MGPRALSDLGSALRSLRRARLWLGAATLLLVSGCAELRGRRWVREGNHLYREGHYTEAVAAYERAESLIPNFWLLWLNKGLTCRQQMIPGSRQPSNERAANCALQAFDKLRQLRPADARGDALYVQTLFDADRFQTLADLYQARLRANPNDLLAMSGLIQVYTRWGHLEEALQWYQRRAAARPRAIPRRSMPWPCSCGDSCSRKAAAPRWPRSTPAPTRRSRRRRRRRPPPSLGDIVGAQRVRLADLGISYINRALALRPKYPEAIVYRSLL